MNETFNQVAAVSLFAATVLFAVADIWVVRRLIKRAFARGYRAERRRFIWVLHIFACVFIFVPVVMWQLVAYPAASAIPATLALAIALRRYRHVPLPNKLGGLVVVVVSTAMWISYGLYENQMQLWAKTVIAPIRVDLEVVVPLLYYSSVLLFRFTRGATHELNAVT